MPSISGETDMDDGGAVIEFVSRLHAAATGGRKLLEAVEAGDVEAGFDAAAQARAAYDRLAQLNAGCATGGGA